MTDRATLNQVTQIGVEATPGDGGDADILLQAVSITPGIQVDVNSFRPVGAKFHTIAALGKEWVEAGIEGAACYNHLAYLLSGILGAGTPTQQGATAAYKWTFTPEQSEADSISTFVVEQGSDARAGSFVYGLINQLSLRIDRSAATIGGSMLGQAYEDAVTMTAAPTPLAVQPLQPTEVDVYIDDSGAGVGSSQLERALRAEIEIGDRFGPVWALNSSVDGYAAHVETAPSATLKLLVEADADGMEPLTALRSGAKRFIRILATGPEIASPYNYKLQWDLCGQVREVSEFSDEDGVYGIEWTFDIAYDATWGKAMTVELINTVTAL